jgi:hypothetical protein
MREACGRGRGQTRRYGVEERVCARKIKISKVWLIGPSTLELWCSHIKAKLGEFVEADKEKKA